MMAAREGNRAWLFQYKADDDADWLQQRQDGKRVLWSIIRWAHETRPGDLVFFWEAGTGGGLRGWGIVEEPPYEEPADMGRRWRVPVGEMLWLEEAIPRDRVLESGALHPQNLLLRVRTGSNFRIEPEEAARLMRFMPTGSVPPPLEGLERHAPSAEGSGSNAGQAIDIEFTQLARAVVEAATFRLEGVDGPVSTSRLFLAAIDMAGQLLPAKHSSPDAEASALIAFGAIGARHAPGLERLRASFLKDQASERGSGGLTFTRNATSVLEQARRGPFGGAAGGRVSADGLVAALLTLREGRVLERLAAVGLSQSTLGRELLQQIAATRQDMLPQWQAALGIELQSDDTSPPDERNVFHIPLLGNDNAWQKGLDDMLGADDEARAFAALALSPQFTPPLAVGVFGEWGSGKSFFMRLVHEHVERFAPQPVPPGRASQSPFVQRVVQIRFNAWHYVDTNLWASLVDHIFTELDKAMGERERSKSDLLFEQLATARELTLESAERLIRRRKEQAEAARKAADAQRRLEDKELSVRGSPKVYWEAVKRHFISGLNEGEHKAFAEAARRLGVEQAIADGQALNNAVRQLEDERGRARMLAEGLRSQLGSWTMAVLFAVACLAVPLVYWLAREALVALLDIEGLRQVFTDASIAVSGVFTAAAGVFAAATHRVRGAIGSLQKLRDHLDVALRQAVQEPQAEVRQAQDELARLNAEVAESQAVLAATTERLSEAAREYNAGTGRARLLRFVRERAAGETYSRHLGLVATVRKDFEELAAMMEPATSLDAARGPEHQRDQAAYKARVDALIRQAGPDADGLLHADERQKLCDSVAAKALDAADSIDRIVLYIDDLDRCQPRKVAEVLQAVHLLLSFKLFVVLVAVDVRWVSRALKKNFPMLLDDKPGRGAASAHDYLEKIFQVPYWVRPMNDDNSVDFMHDRLVRQRPRKGTVVVGSAPTAPGTESAGAPPPVTAPSAGPPPSTEGQGPSEGPSPSGRTDDGRPDEALDTEPTSSAHAEAEAAAKISRHLELSEAEERYMERLARCAGGSPRRVLRFLNVYQVVKASLPEAEARKHVQGEFHTLMTQVAIVTGAPDLLDRWIAFLVRQPASATVGALLEALRGEHELTTGGEGAKLEAALRILADTRPALTAADLQAHAGLARRYSFTG